MPLAQAELNQRTTLCYVATMSQSNVKKKLEAIVREVLNLDVSTDHADLSIGLCPAWDSLRHVELCLRIQKEFKVRFDGGDLVKMRSYQELERTLFAHLGI